jgi:hypothetical protein
MTVAWPIDKLTLLNSALGITGDNQLTALADGSDEYLVVGPAYDRALAFMLETHGWVHAVRVEAGLAASATAPEDTQYNTAYAIPPECLHLIWVRRDLAPADYTIVGDEIWVRNYGNPGTLSIKYVTTDKSEPDLGTPTFVLALQTFVMSAIYRGLHGDKAEAATVYKEALGLLQIARTRSDQQKPRRALFNSRLMASRRVRRPWRNITDWGNNGSPGY